MTNTPSVESFQPGVRQSRSDMPRAVNFEAGELGVFTESALNFLDQLRHSWGIGLEAGAHNQPPVDMPKALRSQHRGLA